MRNPFIQLAAMAAMVMAASRENALRDFTKANGGYQPRSIFGRSKVGRDNRDELRAARMPKWLRQHSKRYGSGPDEVLRMHKRYQELP